MHNPNLEVSRHLISDLGADVNAKGGDSWTPLHRATRNRNVEVLRYLASVPGVDVNAQDKAGKTPLDIANTEAKKAILRAAGGTATPIVDIFEAAEKGTVNDVKRFLDQGVDVNTKNPAVNTPLERSTPLHLAAWRNADVEVTKYLVSKGADVNAKDRFGYTPLYRAADAGSLDVVKYLVTVKNIDLNVKANTRQTALDAARTEEKKAIIRAAGGTSGKDIFEASSKGTVNEVQYFLDQGIDVNSKDGNNDTPLHLAAWQNSDVEVTKYLVSKGADVNAKGSMVGMTPLLNAARFNRNVDVVKHLVSQGADVNAKSGSSGNTPLHWSALVNPNPEVLKYLVTVRGVDVNAKNNQGQTPLDVASTEEKKAILRAAGGKSGI